MPIRARRFGGTNPVTTNTTAPAKTIAARLVVYRSIAPRANVICPASSATPTVASGGTSATATATPGSDDDASFRTVAYAPAKPAARATTRSRMSGAVRLVTSRGRSPLTNNAASTYDSAIEPRVAKATTPNHRNDFRNSAIEIHAAVANTGCINGASNMAPMTTAAESADRPITATTTDNVSIVVKRKPQCSCRLIPSSAITRWRSSESRWRCHHTGWCFSVDKVESPDS